MEEVPVEVVVFSRQNPSWLCPTPQEVFCLSEPKAVDFVRAVTVFYVRRRNSERDLAGALWSFWETSGKNGTHMQW